MTLTMQWCRKHLKEEVAQFGAKRASQCGISVIAYYVIDKHDKWQRILVESYNCPHIHGQKHRCVCQYVYLL